MANKFIPLVIDYGPLHRKSEINVYTRICNHYALYNEEKNYCSVTVTKQHDTQIKHICSHVAIKKLARPEDLVTFQRLFAQVAYRYEDL